MVEPKKAANSDVAEIPQRENISNEEIVPEDEPARGLSYGEPTHDNERHIIHVPFKEQTTTGY